MAPEFTDRATVTVAQIGRTQFLTKEGYLYCEGVRLARTGPMLYKAGEVKKVEPVAGIITLNRDEAELFEPDTVLSFGGKPVTNDHPPEMLNPGNVGDYAVGTILHPRRGEGLDANYLVGDLLIMDAEAIADVASGKREVSCGYHAEVEQVVPGVGRQYQIRGNHVALVTRGRAGPECAIQDSIEEPPMPTVAKQPTLLSRIFGAARSAKDESDFTNRLALTDAADDEEKPEKKDDEDKKDGPEETKDSSDLVTQLLARFDGLEGRLASLEAARISPAIVDTAPEKEEKEELKDDKEEKEEEKMDAASVLTLHQSFHDTFARATILAPGITKGAFDPKSRRKTEASMTDLKRRALSAVFADSAKVAVVAPILGTKKERIEAMGVGELDTCFIAASEVMKSRNNAGQALADKAPKGSLHTGSSPGVSPTAYQQQMEAARKRAVAQPATNGRPQA